MARSSAPVPVRRFMPLAVALAGKKVLVAGAGRVALRKARQLLAYGARLLVVAPQAVAGMRGFAAAGRLAWRKRKFRATDLRGCWLVIAATNNRAVNATISRACRARRIWCTAVDDLDNCEVIAMAVRRRRGVVIAVGTDGRRPALAGPLAGRLTEEADAYLTRRHQP